MNDDLLTILMTDMPTREKRLAINKYLIEESIKIVGYNKKKIAKMIGHSKRNFLNICKETKMQEVFARHFREKSIKYKRDSWNNRSRW